MWAWLGFEPTIYSKIIEPLAAKPYGLPLRILRKQLFLPSLPNKADFNLNWVFALPPSGNEVLLSTDRLKTGRKVGTAFIHLHPPDSITGSHPYSPNSTTGSRLLSLPWHMPVLQLYATSYAAASLSPSPKAVSPSVDNQAIIYPTSCPGYSFQAPLPPQATPTLLFSSLAVQIGLAPSNTDIIGNGLADAAAKLAAEGNPPAGPTCALRFVAGFLPITMLESRFPGPWTPPGVTPLQQKCSPYVSLPSGAAHIYCLVRWHSPPCFPGPFSWLSPVLSSAQLRFYFYLSFNV